MNFFVLHQYHRNPRAALFYVAIEVPAETWEDARDWVLINCLFPRYPRTWNQQLVCTRSLLEGGCSYTAGELRAAILGEYQGSAVADGRVY